MRWKRKRTQNELGCLESPGRVFHTTNVPVRPGKPGTLASDIPKAHDNSEGLCIDSVKNLQNEGEKGINMKAIMLIIQNSRFPTVEK